MYTARFSWTEPEFTALAKIIQKNLSATGLVEDGLKFLKSSARIRIADSMEEKLARVNADALSETKPGVHLQVIVPINEDFSPELTSSFSNLSEKFSDIPLLGSIQGIFQKLNTIGSASSGKTSVAAEYYKVQSWDSTDPWKLSFKIMLDTRSDPLTDVWIPAVALMSQAILSVDPDDPTNAFTPGVNMKAYPASIAARQKQAAERPPMTNTSSNDSAAKQAQVPTEGPSKVLSSFEIVTVNDSAEEVRLFNIKAAFIQSCKPTISKEQTASGLPLWVELDVSVQSVFSAIDSFFSFPDLTDGSLLNAIGRGVGTLATTSIAKTFR